MIIRPGIRVARATSVPEVPEGPITINSGGVIYGRYFKSTDGNIPAIKVQTYDPVIIFNCKIEGAGHLIKADGGSQINAHHNIMNGLTPNGINNGQNRQYGRALDVYEPQNVTFEHNTINHTGGILVDHSNQNTTAIYIRYNILNDTDKRRADLSIGNEHANGIQFNTVRNVIAEISWNQIVNRVDFSRIEDGMNMYNSSGKSVAQPIRIHNNYVDGAYPYPVTAQFSGSGITVDGDPAANTFGTMSSYIIAYDNQVLRTGNACMNIAAGHDVHYYNNTMISSGKLPDGTDTYLYWSACCVFNGSKVAANLFSNVTIQNNIIGFRRPGISTPFNDRQDWYQVPINEQEYTTWQVEDGDNTSIPNPITLQTELDEWPKWKAKQMAAGITVGHAA